MRRVVLPPLVLLLVATMALSACDRALAEPPEGSTHITIDTPDGEQLDAIEMGSGPDVAIMSHGDTGTKEGFYRLVEPLASDGWRVIDYDARGVGNSTGGPEDDRPTDLRAVVDYARDTGAESIVLLGASLGASLSIAMAGELHATALVSLSAPALVFNASRRRRRSAGHDPGDDRGGRGQRAVRLRREVARRDARHRPRDRERRRARHRHVRRQPRADHADRDVPRSGPRRRLNRLSVRTSGTTGRC